MSDPVLALQKAVYDALSAALSCPVYDDVPAGASMPYVSIDTIAARSADPLAGRRDEVFVYMTAWSRYRGRKEAQDIANLIYDTLHRAKLSLASGRNVRCFVRDRMTRPDLAAGVYQAPVSVRCIVEH